MDTESYDYDSTIDPTNGSLEPTEFPPDEVPDPDQTPEDQGVEDE